MVWKSWHILFRTASTTELPRDLHKTCKVPKIIDDFLLLILTTNCQVRESLSAVCCLWDLFSSEMQEIHFMLCLSWNRKNENSNTSVPKFSDYKVPEPQLNNQHYRDLKSIKFDLTLHNRNPKLLSNSENHALLKYYRNACVVTNHKKYQDYEQTN